MLTTKAESTGKLGINVVSSTDGVLVSLHGYVDIDSSPALRDRLLRLFQAASRKTVNIDLSDVIHLDSSGIATLIEALKIARGHKIELRLQGLQGRLLHLFESTGILKLFNESFESSASRRPDGQCS